MKVALKSLVLAAVLALTSTSAARAESPPPVGYVDFNKAIRDTADGQKTEAQANAVYQSHAPEIQAAKTEAKQTELDARYRTEAQRVLNAGQAPLVARASRLLPKIRDAHKLGAISDAGPGSASGVLVPPSKLDYTAELTKRLDAGEGKTDEEAQAELQRKNQEQAREIAELRAKVAEAKKPEATTPAAPPLAPRPTVAKK